MPAARVRMGAGFAMALLLTTTLGVAPAGATAVQASRSPSAAAEAPGTCPTTMAQSAITEGKIGTGWTVTTGDTPRAFRVRVLGTLEGGIAPGRDLIIIKVSDLPGKHVISQGGGIWSGMSGSPVYIDGKLAGAISYGFSNGPSRIGGMTPARQMARIAAYSTAASRERTSVRLPQGLRATIAREARVQSSSVPSLRRLSVPIVVSGARGVLRKRLTTALRRQFGSIKVLAGSGASARGTTTLAAPPVGGGNLAGVISMGDITIAAVGTTTSVCGDTVLGFGHPMTAEGKVAYGAARASSITIVDDPAGTPFKLANVGRLFGLLDQDRLSGIRATIGKSPRLIPVSARVRALDSGLIRTGRTAVTDSAWIPTVAANHLLYDIFTTADSQGPGTASLWWDIRGTRPNGKKWSLIRADRVATADLVGVDAGQMLFDQLSEIASTTTEKVRFDSISMRVNVSPRVKAYTITSVLVSRNGGSWKQRSSISAHPGDELRFKVGLRIHHGGKTSRIVSLTVPSSAEGEGYLVIGDDAFGDECSLDPSACPTTFNGMLQALRDAPRNDDLRVALDLSGFDGNGPRITSTKRLDKIVEGSIELPITVS